MAKSYFTLLLVGLLYILGECEAQAPLAPALYVFGDSTVDVGNNNMLKTLAKANYAPYGVDFPGGVNGRPTNGQNMADFIASKLGISSPPAYRLVDLKTYTSAQGFNYASSSAGILPETGFKGILTMDQQVGLFKTTVGEYLPTHLPNPASVSDHLSKSIFMFVVGSNDYGLTFLGKHNGTAEESDFDAFATSLLDQYAIQLEAIYNLGARKFVVFDIEPTGCAPAQVQKFKPQNSKCVDDYNAMVSTYNAKLPNKLQELQSKLQGSTFVLAKHYNFMLNLVQKPACFGLKEVASPCCPVTPLGICDAKRPPCPDRSSFAFFDAFHPTEATYKALAETCFSGNHLCVPNIQQLATLQFHTTN